MAVSPTDYTKYSTKCQMLSTSVQDKVGNLFALALTAYGSDNNFKNLFFCDAIVSWVDTDNKPCIIGLCRENSDNYNHHAAARRSYIRVGFGGVNNSLDAFVAMNDAGLNTMPHTAFPSNALKAHYCNYIKVQVGMTAAYYIGGNSFEVHIYKNGSWVYSQYAKYNQPAQYANITTVTFENVSGLTEGDQITLIASATNAEGTYTQPTVITTTLLARMSLTQVYYWASIPGSSTDPTTGTPYVMRIEQNMYYYSATALSGEFYRLFNDTPSGDPLNVGLEQGGEWLYGAQGTPSTADPTNLSALPDGYYFGVPNTWQGSDLKYVKVSSGSGGGKILSWYNNSYNPAPVYTVTLSWTGNHNTATGVYTVILRATISGTYNSLTLSTKIYSPAAFDRQGNPIGTLIAQPSVAVTSSVITLWQTTTTDSTASYMTWQTTGSTAPQTTPTEVALHVTDLPDNT